MDLRLCDQSNIFISFYFCYFFICVSVLWMFWTPSMYHVCMIHLFLLPVHVVFGRYFHLILNLCLIHNLSQMCVNIFIANFEFRYVNLVKFIVYMFSSQHPTPHMKVGTLNVNGFVASATKRSHILNFISKEKLDIIRLQETHLTDNDNTSDIFKDFKGKVFLNSCNIGRKWVVAILIREGLDCSVSKIQKDTNGRILSLLCQLKSHVVNIVNLYYPVNPCHRAEFIASTVDYYITTHDKLTVTNRIVCGDFNCVDDVTLDRTGTKNQDIRATVGIKQLNTIIENYSLHDAYRHLHPDQTSYKHITTNSINHIHASIDCTFQSSYLLNCNKLVLLSVSTLITTLCGGTLTLTNMTEDRDCGHMYFKR